MMSIISNLLNKEYIIVELIPTSRTSETGDIAQLSALKINGLKLIERFDYRLNNITNPYIREMINYDEDYFNYVDTTEEILNQFRKFINDDLLLIIDNDYTKNYLKTLKNKKESIFNYLDTYYYDDVISDIIIKYNLQPSNYIVDLLYEALIYQSNNKINDY